MALVLVEVVVKHRPDTRLRGRQPLFQKHQVVIVPKCTTAPVPCAHLFGAFESNPSFVHIPQQSRLCHCWPTAANRINCNHLGREAWAAAVIVSFEFKLLPETTRERVPVQLSAGETAFRAAIDLNVRAQYVQMMDNYFTAPRIPTTSSSTILFIRAIATMSSGLTRNSVSSCAASPDITPPPGKQLANSTCTSA